ncbi:tetratricopeptide repeat protein [Pseudovibrio sp. JE062]|uniref:tetratricopeptide repeat protein n=1 Tax=Pseudovibrio sp. JE062 TaxID=439495 RepID=UPI000186BC4E|nr:tetratricopeptide repeat protein [Pseudovibrio sp. JE062]EEA96603.1 tetratricopeptide repeat domain protein [Pseudovibrio sp. JE062]
MTRFRSSHNARKEANRNSAFHLLWVIMFALGLSIPTQSQNPAPQPEPSAIVGNMPYTNAQKDAYYISLLKDRQDSQSLLQSKWRDYRSYPLLDLAYRLLAEGRTEAALRELDELLKQDPDHLVARWQKVQLLIGLNRPLAAIDQLETLQTLAPAFSRGYLSLGHLQMLTAEYAEAFDDFRLAIETGKLLPSDREEALAGAAEAAIRLGKTKEALHALNILRELGAATPRQRLIRADLLRNFNQLEEARSEWDELSKLDNAPRTQRTAILNEAFLLLEQGKDEDAYRLLLRGEMNGLFTGRQSSALEQRTFARALSAAALNSGHLDELLAFLLPGRIDLLGLSTRVQLAYALVKKGSSAEAEMALLTADGRILDTKASGPEEAANYYLALADIAIRAGDDARAVTAGRLLIKLTRSPEYGLQLSKVALANGWETQAINALVELRAITQFTDRQKSPEAWVELLQTLSDLARRAGDLDLANEVLKEAEALMPNWRITAKRGQVALLSNKHRIASAVLQDALARAKRARAAGAFNENDKKAYARLLFDLAAVSATNEDWTSTLDYLIADWKLQPDPTLVLPAYLMLKESTAKDVTANMWLNYVFAYTNTANLTIESKEMYAASFLSLARLLKTEDQPEEAQRMYRQSLRLNPAVETRLEAAYLALQLNHPRRALMLVQKLDQTKNIDAIMAIKCEAYRSLGRNLEALACAREEALAQPASADKHLTLASLYLRLGDRDKARQELQQAYELSPSLATANQLGFLYQQLGEIEEAEEWFEESFEEHDDQTAGMALLFINLRQMDYAQAEKLLSELDPTKLSQEQMAGFYAARAQLTLHKGDQSYEALESALDDFRRARAISSTPDNRFSVVQVLFQLDQLQEAEAEYEQLPPSDKNNPATLALGGYLARAQGDYDLAITRFEHSLHEKPDQANLEEDLAYTYLAAYENKKAAEMFRKRIHALNQQHLDIYEQDKLERFQRQLRILEIPISFLFFDGASPSRQDEEDFAGAILGIPSSSPFGSLEVAWRPPVIGYQNGRVFEIIARAQWLNERYSFRPNPDTYQTIVGLRFKPFMTQNLKIGLERFFKGGSITEDNWLGRVLWSFTTGNDFLPLYDMYSGEPIDKEPYVSLYLEGGRFFENEKTILFYGDGRLGYTFRLDPNLILSPFAYSIGSGNWNSQTSAVAIEAGLGASLKWRGWYTETYGDLLQLEVFGRVGHEVLNTDDSQTSRVLLGLQANF